MLIGFIEMFLQKNLHLWDIAAVLILVKEAGGITNKINLDNNKDHKIIASSPDIKDKIILTAIVHRKKPPTVLVSTLFFGTK